MLTSPAITTSCLSPSNIQLFISKLPLYLVVRIIVFGFLVLRPSITNTLLLSEYVLPTASIYILLSIELIVQSLIRPFLIRG